MNPPVEVSDDDFPDPYMNVSLVRCTFPRETPPRPRAKVLLRDPGTCAIPKTKTITLDQWKRQQKGNMQ